MKYFFIPFFLMSFFSVTKLLALPAQLMLISQAEKSAQGNDLSLKGKERAAALAPYFTETENLIANGMPVAIYAMAATKASPSLRPMQTVAPLADQLKLTLKNTFERDNYKKMVEEIKSDPALQGKTVLICWEPTLIPEIARAFGALQAPNHWPREVFDRTWLITIASNGRTSFQNLPQRLIYGDSFN